MKKSILFLFRKENIMNYWIWFATIKGLGPIQKKKLLDVYGTPENIYNTKIDEIEATGVLKNGIAEEIEKSKNVLLMKKYERYIQKNNIHLINITDENYPKLLKEIYDPPITLFCKGDITLLNQEAFAIIGCRNATSYGNLMSKEIAYKLAKENILIVSGLAKGIDVNAHRGALMAHGKTIAVLGCGVDIPYPTENIGIYKEIIQKGLVISEYIVGTKPEAGNFPARNRIISGLTKGILVVEATQKSGSMITVDFALDQGRNVYAVPGNINSPNSVGTNELIKQGAKLVTSYEEILEDIV